MEIRNRPNGPIERPRTETGDEVIDLTRTNRQRIADAVQDLESGRLEHLQRPPDAAQLVVAKEKSAATRDADHVDVSVASQVLSADEDAAEVARRRAQIETVRAAVAEGSLATPERVERAARKLLGA